MSFCGFPQGYLPPTKNGVEPKRPSRPINITSLVRLSTTVPNTIVVSWTSEIGRVMKVKSVWNLFLDCSEIETSLSSCSECDNFQKLCFPYRATPWQCTWFDSSPPRFCYRDYGQKALETQTTQEHSVSLLWTYNDMRNKHPYSLKQVALLPVQVFCMYIFKYRAVLLEMPSEKLP